MELLEPEARERLLEENEEYRRLQEKHRQFEERLEQIAHRRPFTQQDWFEESVVKKRKLRIRDRMAALVKDDTAALAH